MKHPFILSTLFLLVGPSAFPQTPAATPSPTPFHYTYELAKDNLIRYIQEQMDKNNLQGLSIALVDGKDLVWAQGFGFADKDKKIPATADTRYALGGVSRVFTAAEVMHLAEQGKVALDAPLAQAIPGFFIHGRFKKAKPITPRALLGDHSGLPGFFVKGIWVDEPETLKELVKDLKEDYLYDPPQTRYRYSYTDYDLLGRLVEVKRKKPFADSIREDLFEPLGMDSSAFEEPGSGEEGVTTAQGYINGASFERKRLRDIPAAGMLSSANDLGEFLKFLFGAKVGAGAPLNTFSRRALLTPYPHRPLDFGHEVGMGWNFTGFPVGEAGQAIWCDGTYPGYFAALVVLPEEELAVAILSNSSEAGKMADGLADRALKLALQVKIGVPQVLDKKKPEMPKTVEVPRETLESYAGIYSALGQVAPVQLKDKTLGIEFQGHQLDLLPISQETFVPHLTFLIFPIDLPQYPLTFKTVEHQDVAILGGLHFPVPLQKIEPVEVPEAWKDRMGDYTLENPDGQLDFNKVTLEMRGDFLTVAMKVSMKALNIKDEEFKIAILPLSDADAVVPGLFYGDGGTLHAVEDGEGNTRVYYSGYWFKHKTTNQGKN